MNRNFLKEGPVVAIVFEGHHSVELGRKLVGATEPRQSPPGTIRGDFMLDSYKTADRKSRSLRNLIHASGTSKEAEREIDLWFKENELYSVEECGDGCFVINLWIFGKKCWCPTKPKENLTLSHKKT